MIRISIAVMLSNKRCELWIHSYIYIHRTIFCLDINKNSANTAEYVVSEGQNKNEAFQVIVVVILEYVIVYNSNTTCIPWVYKTMYEDMFHTMLQII